MNHVDPIARAVLYEGYLLYPYRVSALKNQQRFHLGAVYPRSYAEDRNGADAWTMQTECLVRGGPTACVHVTARYLQLRDCTATPAATPGAEPHVWQEAVERTVPCSELSMRELTEQTHEQSFRFTPELDRTATGSAERVTAAEPPIVSGTVLLTCTALESDLYRLRVQIRNETPLDNATSCSYAEALRYAMISTHTILEVIDGSFVSLLEPPAELQASAAACTNIGTWPVLVGEYGAVDRMLSAPIILYDYPRVAPESLGDFCDATEIDEMLSLRILTLTEAEKAEMRSADGQARALLHRTETLTNEQMLRMHGVMRSSRPV